eukprot:1388771-Prymnesium_polylepis.2
MGNLRPEIAEASDAGRAWQQAVLKRGGCDSKACAFACRRSPQRTVPAVDFKLPAALVQSRVTRWRSATT